MPYFVIWKVVFIGWIVIFMRHTTVSFFAAFIGKLNVLILKGGLGEKLFIYTFAWLAVVSITRHSVAAKVWFLAAFLWIRDVWDFIFCILDRQIEIVHFECGVWSVEFGNWLLVCLGYSPEYCIIIRCHNFSNVWCLLCKWWVVKILYVELLCSIFASF